MWTKRYGKTEYVIATLPDAEWKFSYSATALQTLLSAQFESQRLTGIYVNLQGYLEALRNDSDIIDLTYFGDSALITFERSALQLRIHAIGMVEYRIIPISEIKLHTTVDYPPEDMGICKRNYFFNASKHNPAFSFTRQLVRQIEVKGTDCWAFSLPNFDEAIAEAAAKKNDLPWKIVLKLEDSTISIVGDCIEYFFIQFKKKPTASGERLL